MIFIQRMFGIWPVATTLQLFIISHKTSGKLVNIKRKLNALKVYQKISQWTLVSAGQIPGNCKLIPVIVPSVQNTQHQRHY